MPHGDENLATAALGTDPPKLVLGFLVKALDIMPAMCIFHQHRQQHRAGEVAPVVGPVAAAPVQRAFADQPPTVPLACSVLAPRPHGMKFSRQPASTPTPKSLPRCITPTKRAIAQI